MKKMRYFTLIPVLFALLILPVSGYAAERGQEQENGAGFRNAALRRNGEFRGREFEPGRESVGQGAADSRNFRGSGENNGKTGGERRRIFRMSDSAENKGFVRSERFSQKDAPEIQLRRGIRKESIRKESNGWRSGRTGRNRIEGRRGKEYGWSRGEFSREGYDGLRGKHRRGRWTVDETGR